MKGIVFGSNKYAYIDVPKVACTSIKNAIYSLEERSEFERSEKYPDIHSYYVKNKKTIKGCERTFLIVRDPIKRFLSAYGNRVCYHGELSRWFISTYRPELLKEIPVFNPGIGQFIDYLDIYIKSPSIYHHVQPINKLLNVSSLSKISDLYKIEDLSDFSEEITKSTGKPFELGRYQTHGKKIHIKDLSKLHLEKLIDFYRKDYDLLRGIYSIDDVWKEWSQEKNSSFPSKPKAPKVRREERPFIIWTLRRTGGTNLANALFGASSYKNAYHEPFNIDRKFNFVQNNWKASQDPEQLLLDVQQAFTGLPLIKHCLEVCPMPVNMAIMAEAARKGYKHLFLYREGAQERLLSLNFAQLTNVWGKEQVPEGGISDDVYKSEIPVESIIKHELNCRKSLASMYELLLKREQKVEEVSFEELYVQEKNSSKAKLDKIVDFLKLEKGYFSSEVVNNILMRGSQGTKSDYLKFKRSDEFISEVSKLPAFKLTLLKLPMLIRNELSVPVTHFEIWDLQLTKNGTYILSGVLLAKDRGNVWLESEDGRKIEVNDFVESARMKNLYPNEPGSGNCRFESQPFIFMSDVSVFTLLDGKKTLLAKIVSKS